MATCLAITCVTGAADALFQCQEGVFHPRLADLFKTLVVIQPAAHPIEILRNDRVISLRQRKPIDWLIANVTRVCSYCQTNLCSRASRLHHGLHISDNDIRTGHWSLATCDAMQRRHRHRLRFAVYKLIDLDGSHRGANGYFSNSCTGT